MDLDKLTAVVDALCDLPRIGWVGKGVSDPETVGEHTILVALLAAQLAKSMGLDAGHAALLALIHDVSEHRLGDVAREVREADMENWRRLELEIASELGFGEEFREYSTMASDEAKVVAISDKLATLLRACLYKNRGADVSHLIKWYSDAVKSMLGYLNGEAAAEAIKAVEKCLARRYLS